MSLIAPPTPVTRDAVPPAADPPRHRIVQVGLDLPLANAFDFLLPAHLHAEVGSLVVVPFGARRLVGMVIAVIDASDIEPNKLRSIESVKSNLPPLSAEILAVFQFCANYYHAALGQIALNALPPVLRGVKDLPDADPVPLLVSITAAGRLALAEARARGATQRAILQWLDAAPQTTVAVRQRHPTAMATLRRLRDQGWIEMLAAAGPVATPGDVANAAQFPAQVVQSLAPTLNVEQRAAVAAIGDAVGNAHCAPRGRYQAFVIDGITGSGKTEVYLAAIALALAAGRQALVLVPEINLTPAFLRHVRARFPAHQVAAAHSGMANLARYSAWRRAHDGRADIVVGTRLAVFTPMPRLGLIVVDEEHDASFKQQDGIRYSARDVAVFRASIAKCPVVLGSATPSIETLDNAARGRFTRLVLNDRAVASAELPMVGFINLDAEKAADGLTPSLLRAIDETVKRGEQAMVFINRRGYAPALVCTSCGWMPECHRCSARMVFHRAARRLKCHHCGSEARAPSACGECGATDLHAAGQGSERIEDALIAAFPDRRIARVDRDSTRKRGSAEKIFAAAEKGEIDILVGTQMLTKGHDFPKLTLVGVVNADGAVFSADFRAAERMAQQLMQVAGRAGRAQLPGRVLIQTRFVDHPVYQAVATHDYAAFVSAALTERESMRLPPYSYLALLRGESRDGAKLDAFMVTAQSLAQRLDTGDAVRVWEPVLATLERKAGYVRKQLMVQADTRRALQQFLGVWIAQLRAADARAVRWLLDVDPIDI